MCEGFCRHCHSTGAYESPLKKIFIEVICKRLAGFCFRTEKKINQVWYIIASLSSDVFERRTSTRSEPFPLLISLDATVFVLPSVLIQRRSAQKFV